MRSAAIFLISVFSSGFLAISPVSAQLELGAAASGDILELTTPDNSDVRHSLLWGMRAGYRMAPWSFSGEYASGSSTEVDRSRSELSVGYSLSDSLELTAGARHEDIALSDVSYDFFIFLPVRVSAKRADIDLTNAFVGMNYESDPARKAGLVGSARLYRGRGKVSTPVRTVSNDSQGYRAELGIRFGPPDRSWIIGAAYEAFELSEQRIDLTSKPVVFVRARYRIPLDTGRTTRQGDSCDYGNED